MTVAKRIQNRIVRGKALARRLGAPLTLLNTIDETSVDLATLLDSVARLNAILSLFAIPPDEKHPWEA